MWVQCYVLISTCTPWICVVGFSLCKVFFFSFLAFHCSFFVAEGGVDEATPLIEGPSDTSEIHTGNLFRSTHLRENIVEITGPVLSFTVQMPQAAFKSGEPVTQPGKSLLSPQSRESIFRCTRKPECTLSTYHFFLFHVCTRISFYLSWLLLNNSVSLYSIRIGRWSFHRSESSQIKWRVSSWARDIHKYLLSTPTRHYVICSRKKQT